MSTEEVILGLAIVLVVANEINNWLASRTMKREALNDAVSSFEKLLGGK